MATLEAIGFTTAGGAIVFSVSLCLFGLAVRCRHPFIAPKATARPRNVIYNPRPAHSSQDRGDPMLGWIPWASGLSYDTLLRGVPGTGTRQGGLAGPMLRATMDGVVLLRFHSLCLRVALLGTILCLGVILPMNLTARCFGEQKEGEELSPGCENYNLTNYDRTTLANIPQLVNDGKDVSKIWGIEFGSLLGRMYGIVLCSWVITVYTCYLMHREWVEVLAMRRVYYLEHDVYGHRKEELNSIMELNRTDDSPEQEGKLKPRKKRSCIQSNCEEDDPLNRRDPWIPHPEQRDTVPNVALYSVLVGSLPSMPQQEVDEDDLEDAIKQSKRLNIDWQLALATSFFDQCVPNQPGFSSSVAAITILPAASDLGRAWSRWYAAAAKLRRLRYIRRLIADLRHYDIDDVDSEGGDAEDSAERGTSSTSALPQNSVRSIYRNSESDQEYYRQVLGSSMDEEVEYNYLMSLNFGPEQTAVYSREFAQSAAACCPYGCCEGRLRRAKIDELLLMEQEAITDVHEANKLLQETRQRISEGKDGGSTAGLSQVESDLLVGSPLQVHKKGHRKARSLEDFDHIALPENYEAEASIIAKTSKPDRVLMRQPSMKTVAVHNLAIDFGGNARQRRNSHIDAHDSTASNEWALVNTIVQEVNKDGSQRSTRRAATGVFTLPTLLGLRNWWVRKMNESKRWATKGTAKVVDKLARDSTYAVITFTSRQAAVAARQCLADGRGMNRWETFEKIPVPPLADAAACSLCPCRGCLRPVTMTLNEKQKLGRKYIARLLLVTIYIFYTIPLTFATSLVDTKRLSNLFPQLENIPEDSYLNKEFLTGIVPALLWTFFFAVCPIMFKSIANFGSNASSVMGAEYSALRYYWWFMVVTAFTGSSLSTMVLNGWDEGLRIGARFQTVLADIARTIPTQISVTWINWMIVRTLITLPLNYMLNVNTFLFALLGWKCCSRLVRGGGPGGPTPYRIYVDSGVCFLCLVALAPASPLVAPCVYLYFLYSGPLMKRNLIYVYRPKNDAGGFRWPFLFDILVSSMLVGQVLLTTMIGLKQALGPAILAAVPFIPTILYRASTRKRFLRPFEDAALVQTSMLDGWDNREATSMKKREDYRRFLVDAHKAAYVPVCIAGTSDVLTAEPAIVIGTPNDQSDIDTVFGRVDKEDTAGGPPQVSPTQKQRPALVRSDKSQYGVTLRRVTPREDFRHFDFNRDGSVSMRFSISATDLIGKEEDLT